MSVDRTFLVSRDDQGDAWNLGFRLGARLKSYGVAARYGIAVRKLPGRSAGAPAWGLYLVDRLPAEPVPVRLALAAGPRLRRTLVAELLALTA
ncbi:hypothetical protein ACGF0D_25730 [Kitasatospora sp. NPDC048298]|uniref:hypothetical protein n=1 Tax=Kitasatospora sp. NPDC048298 TaxID=3364049 RepID=UPI003718080A